MIQHTAVGCGGNFHTIGATRFHHHHRYRHQQKQQPAGRYRFHGNFLRQNKQRRFFSDFLGLLPPLIFLRKVALGQQHSLDLEVGVVAGLFSPAAVDHEGDIVDGDGRLGDVGGQHDLPSSLATDERASQPPNTLEVLTQSTDSLDVFFYKITNFRMCCAVSY